MGGWLLEVARMAMYMAFPVLCFHFFNQPEYFENWVTATRRELFPPENKTGREEMQKAIKDMQARYEEEMLQSLTEQIDQ